MKTQIEVVSSIRELGGIIIILLFLIFFLPIILILFSFCSGLREFNCRDYIQQLDQCRSNLKKLENEISSLRNRCLELESIINTMNYTIAEKEELIKELSLKLYEANKTIERLENELKYYKEKEYVTEIRNYLYNNLTTYLTETKNYFATIHQIFIVFSFIISIFSSLLSLVLFSLFNKIAVKINFSEIKKFIVNKMIFKILKKDYKKHDEIREPS